MILQKKEEEDLKMPRNILLIAGAFLMVNIFGCSDGFKYDRYENKDPAIGVSMLYPSGWKVSEDRGSGDKYFSAIFIEPKETPNRSRLSAISVLAVKRSNMPISVKDLETAAANQIAKNEKSKDFNLLSKKAVKILGAEAVELVYKYKTLDTPLPMRGNFVSMEERVLILEKSGKFYFIKLFCQENVFAALDKRFSRVLRSLKFI